MALIYASAVNKRMHQLQKKRSVDIPQPNTDHLLSQQQLSLINASSTKLRSNQRDEYGSGGGATVRSASRDCVGEGRKRSAPPATNRSCAVAAAAAAGRTQQLAKLSLAESAACGGRAKHCRKLAVANGGQFSMAPECAASGTVPGPLVVMDTVARAPCSRKISAPQTTSRAMMMMMSAMALDGVGGGGGTKTASARAEVMRSKQMITREKKRFTYSSYEDDDDDYTEDEDDHGKHCRSGSSGIFAQFTAAFRRRSVSMDDRVLRIRHGTISSSELVSGSPTGEEYGKRTRHQRRKESNTFRKMRDRLNKWKLSS